MKNSFLLPAVIAAFLVSLLVSDFAQARERERQFNRGRGGSRGNERSERVGRIGVGSAEYGGSGCPQGTMNVAFAPDNQSFSILFDQFVAEVGADARKKRDVMSCSTIIPFEIPEGMQMEITRVDYRGFVGIPQGGRAVLHSVLNFFERGQGGRGRGAERDRINIRYRFDGPLAENYEISSGLLQDGQVADTELSPCGGTAHLRITNEIKVVSGARGESASATLDSIDGSSNAVYFVNWRACRAQEPGNVGGRPVPRDPRGPIRGPRRF